MNISLGDTRTACVMCDRSIDGLEPILVGTDIGALKLTLRAGNCDLELVSIDGKVLDSEKDEACV
jgi:hypothetical protein